MRIEIEQAEVFRVFELERVDPILVVLQDFGGKGRITIECYGLAWSTWFGALGDYNLRRFLAGCDADYLANRMWPAKQRRTKHDYAYLVRIVDDVLTAIKAAR